MATGVPGLDDVLGGGIPEYSFNMIAGAPGTGKTTMAEQIMFANATAERPALHFTVLGEPPIKMLRYQQQFDFFDLSRVGSEVRFLNLSEEVLERDLNVVFDRIVGEVERANPGIVVV
ncbi:MAG TPA: ATPase domain-containing protein, partial [Gemmatimonadaceae bacterium]|nr:ATPase domain-containing protein [Gemmatimonadaceae bacterium]